MLDLEDFLHSIDVLYSDTINDEVKINYFSRIIGEEINEDNVEYLFKRWISNNFKSSNVKKIQYDDETKEMVCLLYTSPSPRDRQKSRMPSSA